MTRTRWLIALFWLFVVVMLLRQCNYNRVQEVQEEQEHPKQEHFFFTPPPTNAAPVQQAPSEGPDVRQIAFVTHPNTPGRGSFTCDVTVRNVGRQIARNIQLHVRPYRGVRYGNLEVGHVGSKLLGEADPLSQYGTWITFPDLKPGESSTQSAVFLDHLNVSPGFNSAPEITFETAK